MSSSGWVLFLNDACGALHWNQRELGENLGVSRRTVSRWVANQSSPSLDELASLVRRVYDVDPALAERLAPAIGKTLASLGLRAPSPPQAAAPSPKAMPVADLVDCIVCAVAEAADLSPKTVRPMVLLALRRARELGLDLEALEKVRTPGEALV